MVGTRARRARGACDRNAVEVAIGLEFAPDWNLMVKTWQEQDGGSQPAKAEAGISRDFGFLGVGVAWREEISGNSRKKVGSSLHAQCSDGRRDLLSVLDFPGGA